MVMHKTYCHHSSYPKSKAVRQPKIMEVSIRIIKSFISYYLWIDPYWTQNQRANSLSLKTV